MRSRPCWTKLAQRGVIRVSQGKVVYELPP